MIVLQQAFLPTDTVPAHDPFFTNYLLLALVSMVVFLVGAGFVFRGTVRKAEGRGLSALEAWNTDPTVMRVRWVFSGMAFLSIVGVIWGAVHGYSVVAKNDEAVQSAGESNYQNMIENIKKVYEVDDVRSVSGGVVSPSDRPELFVFQDGVAVEVLYREDEETYEPQLVLVSSPEAEVGEIKKR